MVCICKGSSHDSNSCYFWSEKNLSAKYDLTSTRKETVVNHKTFSGL